MTNDKVELSSMNHQRRVLGWLAILLAPCCILFGLFGKTNYPDWYMSISDTFYANSNIFMIGLLFAIGVYFLAYQGYDLKDRICSLVESISAFGIIIFPTPTSFSSEYVGLFNIQRSISGIFHNTFASILFIAFAYNVLFLFTLSRGLKTNEKIIRNRFYYICGGLILLFMFSQVLYCLHVYNFPEYVPVTLINEFGMLVPFGVAYLIKSGAFKKLNDK